MFWIIPADRSSCNILLNDLYNEGLCRTDSDFIGKDCEDNDNDSPDGMPLNIEMIGENNNPTASKAFGKCSSYP